MTTTQTIRPATGEERARTLATITMAFSDDPVCRWVWKDPQQYLKYFAPFADAFAGAAFDNGSAYVAEGFAGAALWLPPGVGSDDETLAVLAEESVPPAEQAEVFGFLEMQAEFHPHETHWYLPLIGVDPVHQGRGHGSALLREALRTCDEQRLPAYLEATSTKNKALYERHGFEEIGVIQYGGSPPMWAMMRQPR